MSGAVDRIRHRVRCSARALEGVQIILDAAAHARVHLGPFDDSVTLRLWATGQDYTISEDGRVLSGIQGRMRPYSEYWTLIRGAQKKKTDKPGNACPNCGAPMKISMTGNCEYCKVKVTSGEYDWVLSRIEQDEVYTG